MLSVEIRLACLKLAQETDPRDDDSIIRRAERWYAFVIEANDKLPVPAPGELQWVR